jgi:phospholipid/cholesterol/gamma-HCH transport system substrate-binding protein
MKPRKGETRIARKWWALMLVVAVVAGIWFSWALYNRQFTRYAEVTLTSDRAGLVMEPGNAVKMRGIQVGKVAALSGGSESVALKLELDPSKLKFIPSNVNARITASTAFGPKYVELIAPDDPSGQSLAAGAVLRSSNVSTEVNTVFQNLTDLLHQIDPAKLNGILTTLADGLRGRGQTIGEATTDASEVLAVLNSRSETIRRDWQSLKGFSDAYATAAPALVSTLDALSVTSKTIVNQSDDLNSLLLGVTGFANTGADFLAANKDKLVDAVNTLAPTVDLLHKYNPEYTCLLMGARWYLDNGIYDAAGGSNGYSLITDTALLFGNDPYVYPDNLPITAAKGGPGGQPGCGSLPDASKNFPVRQLVTNTGWGTGIDWRPNIGLGHPCTGNYLPVERAIPQPDTYRCDGPPSPGLVVPPTGPLPFADNPQAPPGPVNPMTAPLGPPPQPGPINPDTPSP